MRRIVAVLMLVLICVSFTACAGKDKLVGTWHTYDLGVNIDSPELPPYYSIVFDSDGTGRGPMGSLDRLDTVTFTYTVEDEYIVAVTDENKEITINYNFDGEKLMLEWDGYTRVLTKYSDDVIIEWH